MLYPSLLGWLPTPTTAFLRLKWITITCFFFPLGSVHSVDWNWPSLPTFFRAGWMRCVITTQKPTTQLWLTLCLPPWRAPVSVWTPHAPTLAAGPRMMRESSRPPSSSHAPFSLQRAKYDDCLSNCVNEICVVCFLGSYTEEREGLIHFGHCWCSVTVYSHFRAGR